MHRLGLCAASLVLAFAQGCSKREVAPSNAPRAEHVLRISQRNEPADLDPATATLPDEFFIIRAVSEGLVTPAPSTSPTAVLPGVAERWTISADGLTYTFHLRSDARWSNGEAVTARDFLDAYRRLLTPVTAAPKAALFFKVKHAEAFATGKIERFDEVGFSAPNPTTFVVTLAQPTPQFLLYVASGPWIPVQLKVVERHGRRWTQPENHVGNGPYLLKEWRPNQRIAVLRNPNYHSADRVKLGGIVFTAFDSGDTEERAYRAGQVDVTMAVPPTKLEMYGRERPTELHRTALAETRYLTFNTTRVPLNDRRVRRALSLAINRRQIVERLLRGGQQPAARFVSPALFVNSAAASTQSELSAGTSLPSPESDSAQAAPEARRLLAAAGYAEGRNFPRLELSTWSVGAPIAEAVQQMWSEELGIQVSIVTREAKTHVAALREGTYDIGFITAIPDVPDAANVLENFISGAAGNYPHWSDPAYDELMRQAGASPHLPQQHQLLRRAEDRLLEQSPVAPLYFNARNWLMSSKVRGWQDDALWTRFYLNLELDEN